MLCKLLLVLSIVTCAYDYSEYKISAQFLDSSLIKASNHSDYLAKVLDYNLLLPVIDRLNRSFGPVSSRSEAHITVINPPEFKYGLSQVLLMEEIFSMALSNDLQSIPFEIICLGHQSQFDKDLGKRSSVYNLIVKSEGLLELRFKVYELYLLKGGDPSNFNPSAYYRMSLCLIIAHVTLAFEEHGDWFTEDFVYKTDKTCIQQIELTKYT